MSLQAKELYDTFIQQTLSAQDIVPATSRAYLIECKAKPSSTILTWRLDTSYHTQTTPLIFNRIDKQACSSPSSPPQPPFHRELYLTKHQGHNMNLPIEISILKTNTNQHGSLSQGNPRSE